MVFTTLIGIFKKEEEIESENGYVKISIIQNYKLLWDILNLPCVREFGIALITMQVILKVKIIDFVINLSITHKILSIHINSIIIVSTDHIIKKKNFQQNELNNILLVWVEYMTYQLKNIKNDVYFHGRS